MKLIRILCLVWLWQACGGLPSSSLKEDEVDSLASLSFAAACGEVFVRHGQNLQNGDVRTLTALAKRLPHPGPYQERCQEMATAWQGRRLDLRDLGGLSTMILVKLAGVAELDLAGNGLTDDDLFYFKASTISDHHNQIRYGLQSLSLARNDLRHGVDFRDDYPQLKRLDLSHNRIRSLEPIGLPLPLRMLDLSGNRRLVVDDLSHWHLNRALVMVQLNDVASVDFAQFFRPGLRQLQGIHLRRVASLTVSRRCVRKMEHLLFVNRDIDESSGIDWGDQRCFPRLKTGQEERPAIHCDGMVRRRQSVWGRIQGLGCQGTLTWDQRIWHQPNPFLRGGVPIFREGI